MKLGRRIRFALCAFVGIPLIVGILGASAHLHFDLARSLPAADASVAQVDSVTLWFTEPPAEGSVSVRLISGGALVPDLKAVPMAGDAKAYVMPTPEGLAPGTYTVGWRGMGGDGHVVRGEFGFTVTGR